MSLLPDDLVAAFELAADALDVDSRQQQYRTNPAMWIADRLDEYLWSKQVDILTALTRHRRVAVKSCHGAGKSHTASRAVAWWLSIWPPGTAFVVTTAPTAKQVEAILWRYIGQAAKKADAAGKPLVGRVLTTEWKIDTELIAFGRKPADYDTEAFQGIHAEHVLVVIDEASGVPEQLWTAADSLTSNDGCALLAIGNPADPASYFARACESWHTITISAFDTPNLTGEKVPDQLRKVLVSKSWVEEKRTDWGEDSPLWSEKVLGEFPTDASDQVVRSSDLAKCRQPSDRVYAPSDLLPVVLGVDVGGGGDETVIRERRGRMVGREWRDRNDNTMTVVNNVLHAIEVTGATLVNVDSIGIGAGVCDRLNELRDQGKHAATIVGVNVGQAATDTERFANLRAELWWVIGRLGSERGEWDLAPAEYSTDGVWLSGMENPDAACAQLLAPKWFADIKGRIQIEKKDEVRKRLGRSPDNADALLLSFVDLRGGTQFFMDQWFAQEDAAGPKPQLPPDETPAPLGIEDLFPGQTSQDGWRRPL